MDMLDILLVGGVLNFTKHARFHHIREAHNRIQRRAQLVAHRRQERRAPTVTHIQCRLHRLQPMHEMQNIRLHLIEIDFRHRNRHFQVIIQFGCFNVPRGRRIFRNIIGREEGYPRDDRLRLGRGSRLLARGALCCAGSIKVAHEINKVHIAPLLVCYFK